MAFFVMRFDFREPGLAGTSMADRYEAGLRMCEFADRLGFYTVVFSEHHGSPDGYLPSALTMAAAVAARTTNVRIRVGLMVAALHDPVRVAEQAAVVDLLSKGRLDLAIGNGYVSDEFAMAGVEMRDRVPRLLEAVETLRAAWTGEPFTFRGRTVRVTPTPFTPAGPTLELGASSEPAARRAARLGLGMMPSDPSVWDFFRDETVRLGRPDPGAYLGGEATFFHLAEDVEKGWETIAPYALHESKAYGGWQSTVGAGVTAVYREADSIEELRARGQYRVLTPDQMVAELTEAGPFSVAVLHPLMGGIPPEVAWESLRLLEHEVIPRL
jgi:alkanesulfonate monooxygenase SsuD/methylene tetrahydromethanopterin reductase-like flavin-dependent oxidoreductase (luciferase family)